MGLSDPVPSITSTDSRVAPQPSNLLTYQNIIIPTPGKKG